MKKLLSTFLAILVLSFNAHATVALKAGEPPLYIAEDITIMIDGAPLTLRAGTPVVAESVQTFSGKNLSVGQTVSIRAKFNVVVNKRNLISAGALGTAVVSDVKKRGIFGRGGRLELQIQSIQAVDGQQVLLSGIPLVMEGKSNATLAWVVSGALFFTTLIGGAVGLLIKGKDAEFRAGTQLHSSVASDIEVDTE